MKKNFLGEKWFFEDFLPGEPKTSTWGFKIEKEIFSGKSKFQKIEIFQAKEFGKILVLDGMVQLSTKDEFVYHEILVHPALLSHKKPEKVLIIGGGDGGTLREVVKYPVKEIFLVDIDKKVIEISKRYLPQVSRGAFGDKRLKIFNEDAKEFIKRFKNFFDVIIEDLTDPSPLAKFCWNLRFYKEVLEALKKDGVASFQSGYLKEVFAKKARKDLKKIFPYFEVRKAFVGCFPMDEHTFFLGSKKIDFEKISFKEIERKFKKLKIKTKYYSPKIHFLAKL